MPDHRVADENIPSFAELPSAYTVLRERERERARERRERERERERERDRPLRRAMLRLILLPHRRSGEAAGRVRPPTLQPEVAVCARPVLCRAAVERLGGDREVDREARRPGKEQSR